MVKFGVFLAVFVVYFNGAMGLGFVNSLTGNNPPKFLPTYVQTLAPFGRNVITTHPVNVPFQNPPQQWSNILNDAAGAGISGEIAHNDDPNVVYVVAYGPAANDDVSAAGRNYGTSQNIKEGARLVVPSCQKPIALNAPNGQLQVVHQYCLYNVNDIIGVYQENPWGANRAYRFTSRILAPQPRTNYVFTSN
eukprot:TRINITY_DN68171_c8_g5_i1.p2 TRINITY_DN68171_c8_g5~~TRINITY_DN68171_c8_g5_i1.p2  ORF type:complete len:192 (+),score=21.50 TRINITY_DN68171_c8_g5_i1:38-613(+)